jgi:hypothetical protein
MASSQESYLVVVIRAWREANGLRARMLIDTGNGSEPREHTSCDIDALIEVIRGGLERLEYARGD